MGRSFRHRFVDNTGKSWMNLFQLSRPFGNTPFDNNNTNTCEFTAFLFQTENMLAFYIVRTHNSNSQPMSLERILQKLIVPFRS